MKTGSENANRNVGVDKVMRDVGKKGGRKFLQTLQPSGDKENLVGRLSDSSDTKTAKPQTKVEEVQVNLKEHKSLVAKVNPSLYQKLIIEDLTSTAGPSEKYWEVIAERRRKALEDVLEQNRKLHSIIAALEEENNSCKLLLEETTDFVNTLMEMVNEERENNDDEDGDSDNQESIDDDKDDKLDEDEDHEVHDELVEDEARDKLSPTT
ncbi:Hypothetical protein CINCED_3A014201 [Cinara cedri]|uniref:Geminin n=1 Tax=Cinara cedri TaxID=506608 RepID=A0A5E4MIJ1_9HEMI|nr:Hypothetical protein CINCED_3A014201 [Cinara cedri]